MIEIVFTDSALGLLKSAQSYGQGDFNDYFSAFAIIVTHHDGSQVTEEELEETRQEFLKKNWHCGKRVHLWAEIPQMFMDFLLH